MTTTRLIAPTTGQMKQFEKFKNKAEQMVIFRKESMQRLLARNRKFQKDYTALLENYSITDNRFYFLTSFNITVPRSYNHSTQLATFASHVENSYTKKKKCYCYDKTITDENFANVTAKLIPGKIYMVKIFGIKRDEMVSSYDCLAFLATQRVILVGAQGLSLIRQLKKNELPVGKRVVSFDNKDALWEDADGEHRLPCMGLHSSNNWSFKLNYFKHYLNVVHCILCVCDLSA